EKYKHKKKRGYAEPIVDKLIGEQSPEFAKPIFDDRVFNAVIDQLLLGFEQVVPAAVGSGNIALILLPGEKVGGKCYEEEHRHDKQKETQYFGRTPVVKVKRGYTFPFLLRWFFLFAF